MSSILAASTLVSSAAALVFVVTYFILAVGRMPGLRMDRTGAALLGAALMVAIGALPLEAAWRAVDWNTLALLLGVMIVAAHLRMAGAFDRAAAWVGARVRRPLALLVVVTLASGVGSAFLVNDTVCLVLTPLVIGLARRLQRDPVPYLLAVATASNVGGAATMTGNPQNMIIGGLAGVSYGAFAARLSPVALVGLVAVVALIALLHRREFFGSAVAAAPAAPRAPFHGAIATKALVAGAGMVVAFFAGAPPALAAITAGALLLWTRRVKPEKVFAAVDWPLLLLFAGLFVVVRGAEEALLTPAVVTEVGRMRLDQTSMLSLVTAVLSNLVSNVPAVLVLKPFVSTLADPAHAWLTVAMSSTLAGNLTVVGSVANLIVVQGARAEGVEIGFWDYLRVGAPLTILTILFGTWWLA